jgi:threonine synthase
LEYSITANSGCQWIEARNLNHMAFSPFYPMPDSSRQKPVTLGEGGTPLVHCRHLNDFPSPIQLYVKDEALNPTGSWKDRALSLVVSCAVGFGSRCVVLYSCGNAGSSAAAYSAKAGLRCVVFALPSIRKNMVDEIRSLGGIVIALRVTPWELWVEGKVGDLLESAQKEFGWFPANTIRNPFVGSPYYTEGYKSIAFETVLQLGTAPDWVIVPAGSGEGLCGIWKGFVEMQRLGRISRLPKMVAVQAEGAAPLVRAFKEGLQTIPPISKAATIACGIEVLTGSEFALTTLRESGGCAVSIPDVEIQEVGTRLARQEGLHVSPEGAAAVAGAIQLRRAGVISTRDSVLCISTAGSTKYSKSPPMLQASLKGAVPPNLSDIEHYVRPLLN